MRFIIECTNQTNGITEYLQLVISIISAFASLFMALLTLLALCITRKDYLAHRKREKAEEFSKYNERYSSDPHIKRVIKYIIATEKKNNHPDLPQLHDKEMFMRFFRGTTYSN